MTAIEQLRKARERFCAYDAVIPTLKTTTINEFRLEAYKEWLAAVRRFHMEGR